jgi:hypothetical protein
VHLQSGVPYSPWFGFTIIKSERCGEKHENYAGRAEKYGGAVVK